jgi:hypothetical protein
MVFDDVKVGDQFKEKSTGRLITVTKIESYGIDYTLEPYSIKWGQGVFHTVTGGRLYTKNPDINCWDFLYEKIVPSNICIDCKGLVT